MQLLLNMEDEYSRILDVFEVGDFTYTDVPTYQTYGSSQDLSRKLSRIVGDSRLLEIACETSRIAATVRKTKRELECLPYRTQFGFASCILRSTCAS